jgi:hypothetical protein
MAYRYQQKPSFSDQNLTKKNFEHAICSTVGIVIRFSPPYAYEITSDSWPCIQLTFFDIYLTMASLQTLLTYLLRDVQVKTT